MLRRRFSFLLQISQRLLHFSVFISRRRQGGISY
ncbi:hypothetical protein OIU79_013624, partial [Salix purpurea]